VKYKILIPVSALLFSLAACSTGDVLTSECVKYQRYSTGELGDGKSMTRLIEGATKSLSNLEKALAQDSSNAKLQEGRNAFQKFNRIFKQVPTLTTGTAEEFERLNLWIESWGAAADEIEEICSK
jgi:hypothetical protein